MDMVYVGSFAAVVSVVSAFLSYNSLRTARVALNKKYTIFTACEFKLGALDSISQAYDTVVTIYNLGEVSLLVDVQLSGEIDFSNHSASKINSLSYRLVIKPGDSKSANIKLITGKSKGVAKVIINTKQQNAMNEPISVDYTQAAMQV